MDLCMVEHLYFAGKKHVALQSANIYYLWCTTHGMVFLKTIREIYLISTNKKCVNELLWFYFSNWNVFQQFYWVEIDVYRDRKKVIGLIVAKCFLLVCRNVCL